MGEQWALSGRVRRASDGAVVTDVVVEAWDKDVRFHSLLGQREVGRGGQFSIGFDDSYFGDFGGDARPDVYFKVLRNGFLVLTTEDAPAHNLAPGAHSFTLDVADANLAANPSEPLTSVTPTSPVGGEVVLHELGATLAAAVAAVQRELQRYPGAAGTYVVDDFDVTLPVTVRTDDLGQVLATVTSVAAPDRAMASIRLRTRPMLEQAVPPPRVAAQPIDVLPQLEPAEVEELRRRRIFTVDDLQRVSSTRPGIEALGRIVAPQRLQAAMEQSRVLSFQQLPPRVAEELLRAEVSRPEHLLDKDPEELAKDLTTRLKEEVTADDVRIWQSEVRESLRLVRPGRVPGRVPDIHLEPKVVGDAGGGTPTVPDTVDLRG